MLVRGDCGLGEGGRGKQGLGGAGGGGGGGGGGGERWEGEGGGKGEKGGGAVGRHSKPGCTRDLKQCLYQSVWSQLYHLMYFPLVYVTKVNVVYLRAVNNRLKCVNGFLI